MNGRCGRAKPQPERDRCAREGLPPAEPGPKELALHPDAPGKHSTNYHVLFGKSSFFSKFEDSINKGERGSYGRKERPRPGAPLQVGACSWLEPGGRGLPLETAASLARRPRTYCSIVVFRAPGCAF